MGKLIEVNSLSFGYSKDKLLFDDLSFTLQKGQIKAIVGQSGAGKSTLFELILGNLKPLNGSVSCSRASEVFQDPYSSFHPSYSIINQIKDVARLDELDSYLKAINLDYELLLKLPHEL
jgi:peptide/nickel transport system ATP-binding protein